MINTEDFDIIEHCIKTNTPEYNTMKALEECTEFMEVLIKLQTKNLSNLNRPDPRSLLKEFGDMMYRAIIAVGSVFPEEDVEDLLEEADMHIINKLNELEKYALAGKYKGGL